MLSAFLTVLVLVSPEPTPMPATIVPLSVQTRVTPRPMPKPDILRWRYLDTVLEGAFVVALAADMSTTIDIGQRCGPQNNERGDKLYRCIETNPLLGKYPSRERVMAYGTACFLIHAGIARIMPQPFRAAWQIVWTGVEIDMTNYNLSAGLRFAF